MVHRDGRAQLSLRRFTFGDYPPGHENYDAGLDHVPCPAMPARDDGYRQGHDVSRLLHDVPLRMSDRDPTVIDSNDVEELGVVDWPNVCEHCGEQMPVGSISQVNQEPYVVDDNGGRWTERNMPAGAMFFHDWYAHFGVGPDGRALVVVLPPADGVIDSRVHWWHIDGPARSEGTPKPNAWTRTGEAPNITARPSILTGSYHGFLTDGALVEC